MNTPWSTEVRAFHRPMWQALRESVTSRQMSDSLVSLAAQGYTLYDVGAMFGVSGERVRQWYRKFGLGRPHKKVRGRVWDDTTNRFVPMRSEDQKTQRGQRHKAARHSRQHERRRNMVAALKSLAELLGRTPSVHEYVEYWLGHPVPPRQAGGRLQGILRRQTGIMDLWRDAGVPIRSRGTPGHLTGQKAATFGQRYLRNL